MGLNQGVRLKKGASSPSMLEADFANKNVLDPIQALTELKVLPTGMGTLTYAGATATLDLTPLANKSAGSGTSANPYIMGTNSTTTDATPQNDEWSADDPPTVDGVVTDGVTYNGPRIYVTGSEPYTVYIFDRPKTSNSNGNLVSIGPEFIAGSFPYPA